MKILVIGKKGRLDQYVPDFVDKEHYEIVYVPATASDEEILSKGNDFDFMLVDAMSRVSKEVIDAMPNLKMIHSEGVGYNYFDIDAARARKVYVCNCKAANANAVAEQSVMLMLGLLRFVIAGHKDFLGGHQIQNKEAHMLAGDLKELGECTVGLLGFGDIARATARILEGFGAEVLYSNRTRYKELEEEYHVTYVSREELLKRSDIISLYLNSNAETFHTVDENFLAAMKEGSYLVNTARGDLVDTEALLAALKSGQLAGAGLDTVAGEPVQNDNPFLLAEEDVKKKILFSPHIGGITGGAFRRCHEMFWQDLQKVEKGEKPDHIVNPW